MKLKFKTIVFIVVGVLLLLPVFIYGGKAFVNFTAVIANLSKEIGFIIDLAKFSYKEFFYSSPVMKYVAKMFIGIVGFRFFIGLFFDVYKFSSIHLVRDNEDKKEIRKHKIEKKHRKYIEDKSGWVSIGRGGNLK